MSIARRVESCRCCSSTDLLTYLSLGDQPLANSYHSGRERLPTYPLNVQLCRSCYLSQLDLVVEPADMFREYLYVTGTTETFQRHFAEFAQDALSYVDDDRPAVLDVACNDGTLLEAFRRQGCDVMGVDPAENLRAITAEKHLPVEVAYWNTATARQIDRPFDIITAANVFAHVDDVDEFLQASRMVLKPSGVLMLEFPYCNRLISEGQFDTVYHEHLSYFLVHPLVKLFERHELSIVNVRETASHGGSLRFVLATRSMPTSENVSELLSRERQDRLCEEETYHAFARRAEETRRKLRNIMQELQSTNSAFVGYGASAKAMTPT